MPETPLVSASLSGRRGIWRNDCIAAGVDHIPRYRATKHSTLPELARVLTPQQLQGLARHKKFDTTRIYFGENADPKAEAQTAREALVDAQRDAYTKATTRINQK
jgi:hypothetical protein